MEDFQNRPINERVKLKDIATIKYEEPDRRFSVRVNGKPAAAIVIFKEGEANAVELGQKLDAMVQEMRDRGMVVPEHVNTNDNLADLLTKPLAAPAFKKHVERIMHTAGIV